MKKILILATAATGALLVTACNKPADNAAMADTSANAMSAPAADTMSADNAMDANAMDSNAMAGNMADNAMMADDNATDAHGSSGGH